MDIQNNERIRVVYLASRKLGYQILEWLVSESCHYEIAGVCLAQDNREIAYCKEIRSLCQKYGLREITYEELFKLSYEIGLSVNFDRIIKGDILNRAAKGFWNIHHSCNLRLRGRNITTHAILRAREDRIFYHGTSLHKMVEKLDAGPVVATAATEIDEKDTAYTLFKKVDSLALRLIKEWFPRICFERVFPYEVPMEGVKMFREKDLMDRQIKETENEERIYDIIRAFDYPGFPPAFRIVPGGGIEECVAIHREDFNQIKILGTHEVYCRLIQS